MSTFKIFNNNVRVSFALLAIVEGLIFFGAALVAMIIRFGTPDINSPEVLHSLGNPVAKAAVFAAINMLGLTALGLYQVHQFRGHNGFTQTLARILVSLLLVSMALMVLYYLLPFVYLGRGVTLIAFIISLCAIVTLRKLFFGYFGHNIFMSRVIIFGAGRNAARILDAGAGELTTSSYRVVGIISTPEQIRVVPENLIFELCHSLVDQARELNANEIVIALDDRNGIFPIQHLLDCKLAGIKVTDPLTFLEREQGKVDLSHLHPSWMVFSDGFRGSKLKTAASRMFDITASLSILVITAPVLLAVAFLIALEGKFKEPILYRQRRVGKNGECFDLLKFRSMGVDAETDGAQWAAQNDARVTRVGRVIRSLRVDELPQIFNILRGDMRLVGPRPERPEFVEKLNQNISFYRQRHSVKPGLAGLAQLKYPYGATEQDAYEKLQYDLYYIKNSNPVMDFFILLQTIQVIIFRQGVR